MCIGIPMRVVSVMEGRALAERNGVTTPLDAMLVGDLVPGTWVLAFQGSAVRVLEADEAAQIDAALRALESVLAGETVAASAFADLDRPPELPAHLRSGGT